MNKYTYQNVSDHELTLMGFGVVQSGQQIVTDVPVENPNFKFISESKDEDNSVTGVAGPQPNAVTEATLQENNEEIN